MHHVQEVIRLEGGNNYIESTTKYYKFQRQQQGEAEYTMDQDDLVDVIDQDSWGTDESDIE